MNKFVILTDSGSDLEPELRSKYGVELVPMYYVIKDVPYAADLSWKDFSAKEFYDLMRNGEIMSTAQGKKENFIEIYRKWLADGYDVLYLATSSAISATIDVGRVAYEEIKADYPDRKVVVVDALRACYALGLLVIRASELRAEGKSLDQTVEWLEQNKLTVNMEGSVEKLTYLKQAGRVSASAAFFGGLLNIKPIIMADAQGKNFACEKVRGRRASFERIAERVAERFVSVPYQKMFISHADCYDEAVELKAMILSKLGRNVEVHIGYVGPCVGASVGPGQVGVYFYGKEVTENKI